MARKTRQKVHESTPRVVRFVRVCVQDLLVFLESERVYLDQEVDEKLEQTKYVGEGEKQGEYADGRAFRTRVADKKANHQ